jgi:hypothetical protein
MIFDQAIQATPALSNCFKKELQALAHNQSVGAKAT